MALLSISTMSNRNKGIISNNHSTIVCASQKDNSNNSADITESCLKADSNCQASRIPRREFFAAAMILAIPLNPGFMQSALVALTPTNVANGLLFSWWYYA
jgi:hypothetical protein